MYKALEVKEDIYYLLYWVFFHAYLFRIIMKIYCVVLKYHSEIIEIFHGLPVGTL